MPTLVGTDQGETIQGGADRDAIYGLGGDDRLLGNDGLDTLIGGAGRDTLDGGGGGDRLFGGEGDDLFFVERLYETFADTIVDFSLGDQLRFFANFTFVGTEAFSGGAREVRFEAATLSPTDPTPVTLVQYDGDSDAVADFSIVLYGTLILEAIGTGSPILVVAADRLVAGTDGADALRGGNGRDTLDGGRGRDTLDGGDGPDRLLGGVGRDVLEIGAGDTLTGGAGADFFRVTDRLPDFRATITDFGVGDAIDLSTVGGWTLIDDDAFSGMPGEIRVVTTAAGLEVQFDTDGDGRGDGALTVLVPGGGVFGLVRRDGLLVAARNLLIEGGAGDDVLRGGAGSDTIAALRGADTARGGAAVDRLDGGEGDDRLDGGTAGDRLFGGLGDDTLLGGDGADYLFGDEGADVLVGGVGADTLLGGEGRDIFDLGRIDDLSGDRIDRLEPDDLIDLSRLPLITIVGDGKFTGGGEASIRFERTATGLFVVSIDADGDRVADGGFSIGEDRPGDVSGIEEIEAGSGLFRLAPNRSVVGTADADILAGGIGFDFLSGLAGNDSLDGGIGNDTLDGGEGDDLLRGGPGRDVIEGRDGRDRLDGGAGGDLLLGREGGDVFVVTRDDDTGGVPTIDSTDLIRDLLGNDVIDATALGPILLLPSDAAFGFRPGEVRVDTSSSSETTLLFDIDGDGEADVAVAVEGSNVNFRETAPGSGLLRRVGTTVNGTEQDENLFGSGFDDTIFGADGNDTLLGRDGSDSLNGGAGRDSIEGDDPNFPRVGGRDTLRGGDGNDFLRGGLGDDFLDGGAGDDGVVGQDGDDTIEGGLGFDQVVGGLGADRFVFGAGSLGLGLPFAEIIFDFESGIDRIDLSGIDADAETAENDAFVFVGEAAFTGLGQVRFEGGGLFFNFQGNLLADGFLNLNNRSVLVSDFVL